VHPGISDEMSLGCLEGSLAPSLTRSDDKLSSKLVAEIAYIINLISEEDGIVKSTVARRNSSKHRTSQIICSSRYQSQSRYS
jgi:hypothetical protein